MAKITLSKRVGKLEQKVKDLLEQLERVKNPYHEEVVGAENAFKHACKNGVFTGPYGGDDEERFND